MKLAIVHITPPPETADQRERGAYIGLLQNIEKESQNSRTTIQLAENVWQIDFERSLPILAVMFQGCQAQHLHIRVLFLEDQKWISLDDLS
jgi:hypothetical protein